MIGGQRQRGAAAVDHLFALVVVGALMVALVQVRPHRPERRPPIDPVAHLVAPLSAARPAAPAMAVRPRRATRVTRSRRPRARPRAPLVLVPRWLVAR
ncbi:MAG TPA: hypothetical protein PKE32_07750 [Miltoncostaeaceae bacterium]|nr:hypothetical protein [Miltoncostaeaceae bacterium]